MPRRRPASSSQPPRWTAALTALAVATGVALGGCTGDDGGDAATPPSSPGGSVERAHRSDVTTNPAAAAQGPGIESFEAPATVPCPSGGRATIELQWSAPAATIVRFSLDGEGLPGDNPPTGTTSLTVDCDDTVHVVVLAAVGADGSTSVRSEAVLADADL